MTLKRSNLYLSKQNKMQMQDLTPELKIELTSLIDASIQKALSKLIGSSVTDRMLVEEAAKYVGLSVQTMRTRACQRRIPVSKQGKRLYFSKKELDQWIEKGRRKVAPQFSN